MTRSAAYAGDVSGPAWSPDGKRLVYARDTGARRALFIVNVNGGQGRQLTPWSLSAGGVPDWSSATNRIVFRATTNEQSGVGNFFTIKPNGKSLTQVTHFVGTVISHEVGFSPDGKQIAFAKAKVGEKNAVFRFTLLGSVLQRVTNTRRRTAPQTGDSRVHRPRRPLARRSSLHRLGPRR